MTSQTKTSESFALRARICPLLCVVVPVAIWLAPIGANATARRALAVAAFMIILWVTQTWPLALAGLAGCYLFWVLGVAQFRTAFGGFADPRPGLCLGPACSELWPPNPALRGVWLTW
jgi:di/tricarboxylate transporter